jgi:hypothetical protein
VSDLLVHQRLALREELRLAAARAVARRRRRHRTVKTAAIVVALCAILAAGIATAANVFPWTTASAPNRTVTVPPAASTRTSRETPPPNTPPISGSAAEQLSVFATGTSGVEEPPPLVMRSWRLSIGALPGFGRPLFARARRLVRSGRWSLYAVPTSAGVVCYTATEEKSVGGSCATGLTADKPISVLTSEDPQGDAIVVAGVAADDVVSVRALATSNQSCTAAVANNGFLCSIPAGGKSPSDVRGFAIRLRGGRTIVIPF